MKEALNALYHHPDDAVRMHADRWLQDFQRTIDAWQVISALPTGDCRFFFSLIFELIAGVLVGLLLVARNGDLGRWFRLIRAYFGLDVNAAIKVSI